VIHQPSLYLRVLRVLGPCNINQFITRLPRHPGQSSQFLEPNIADHFELGLRLRLLIAFLDQYAIISVMVALLKAINHHGFGETVL
jgi:hypothetical protein